MKNINNYIVEKLNKINSKNANIDDEELNILNIANDVYDYISKVKIETKYVNKDGLTILKTLNNIVDTLSFITRYKSDFISKLSTKYKISYNNMKCYLKDNNNKIIDELSDKL